jgi:uncharacterized protein YaaN involved in tellurite resistance
MQERMGKVFYSEDKKSATNGLTKDIAIFQSSLEKVNPIDVQKQPYYKVIAKIPLLGNLIIAKIKESAVKGMTLQEFTEHFEETVSKAELNLRQDNAQLKVINDELKPKQAIIKSNIYYGEVLIDKLTEKIKTVDDVNVKNNLNEVLFKVSNRVMNLRATENIIEQFFVSLKMEKNNNSLLIDGARTLATSGAMVVKLSTIIFAAITRSKEVKDLYISVGEYLGKRLVGNATMLNEMATAMEQICSNPFVPMKYMNESVEQSKKAIESTNRIISVSIEASKENSGKLKIWTEDLKKSAGQLNTVDIKSLEASKTLALPSGQ